MSNAIQGAYLVAVVMTGVLFGAGALIFKELTEGLGCLLGGFCLAMWFLVLKSGGTITGTGGKVIFIIVFAVVAWGLSFHRITRPYGLIGSTSFSGATAVVLGIDCFSQAGLKEFWVYIWSLNDNIFPLNTDTYPITRGIRVEIAVIILLCLIGVISQLKLWKLIKDRRDKQQAEQTMDDQRKSAMEEAMGRYLEARNGREKEQWERIYGGPDPSSHNTFVESETAPEKNRKSWVNVSEVDLENSPAARFELKELDLPKADVRAASRLKRQSTFGTILEGDETQQEASECRGESRPSSSSDDVRRLSASNSDFSKENAKAVASSSRSLSPSVTPLPFIIPGNRDLRDPSPRLATTGRLDPEVISKRKSASSLLEKLTGQQNKASPMSRSEEALVVPELPDFKRYSVASSLAATLNDDVGVLDLQSEHSSEAGEARDEDDTKTVSKGKFLQIRDTGKGYLMDPSPSPPALSVAFDPEELARPPIPDPEPSRKTKAATSGRTEALRNSPSREYHLGPGESSSSSYKDETSEQTSADTLPSAASLTKGALNRVPSQLSNVVMTYRTNEWAKHISTAEAPAENRLSTIVDSEAESPVRLAEQVAAINVRELEQATTKTRQTPMGKRSTDPISTVLKPSKPSVNPEYHQSSPSQASDLQRSMSQQSDTDTPMIRVLSPSPTPGTTHALHAPKSIRSSSTPTVKQTVTSIPIDENAETRFASPTRTVTCPEPTANPARVSRRESTTSRPMIRSTSDLCLLERSLSRDSQVYKQTPATVSDTRLSSYIDTHQPDRKTTSFVPERRESMLADWRGSMRHDVESRVDPQANIEQRRADMMLERRQSNLGKQREEATRQSKDMISAQAMRSTDMQALHREAMRKMQAKANKHV